MNVTNKVFMETAMTFDRINYDDAGIPEEVGVATEPNGDIILRAYLPGVENVRFVSQFQGELPLVHQENGVIEATLAYDPAATGPQTIDVMVGETALVYPFFPVYWTGNRPSNFVEVPDADMDYCSIQNVPKGLMSTAIFWSTATENWERCTIYTPPGYMNGTETYPVLYLQHGGSDNETSWQYSGRAAHIFDNLLAKNEMVPCIVVMNNAMLRYGGKVTMFRDRALEQLIIQDCMPFIESNFRVKTGKWNRAIAGLSMGAYMSCDIAFWHPDLFGYLGTFTTSMTMNEHRQEYERPYHTFIKDAKAFGEAFTLYFRSTTIQENHFEWFLDDDALCEANVLDKLPCYHRIVYPETTSKWNSWRLGLRDFAKLVFRQ